MFGVGKEEASKMAQDLWTLLTMKAQGTTRSAVTHAMTEDTSTLTRLSRTWYNLLRDSRGRVIDRQLALTTAVHCPKRLTSWTAVADGFRNWEMSLAELESLSGAALSGALRAQALLALVPEDLRDLALTQAGLEYRYEDLRDYLLNQAGRHDARRVQQQDPMDIGRVDLEGDGGTGTDPQADADGQDALWTGKGPRRGGKGKAGGKGADQKRTACHLCGSQGHWASQCPLRANSAGQAARTSSTGTGPTSSGTGPASSGTADRMSHVQCYTCRGFGHRAGECANNARRPMNAAFAVGEDPTMWNGPVDEPDQGQTEPQSANPEDPMVFHASHDPGAVVSDPHLFGLGAEPARSPDTIVLRSYVDSGAARSVCPRTFGDQFGLKPTANSRRGECFRTATNARVPNEGSRIVVGQTSDGAKVSMQYSVADISVALDSVSQICDTGARVVFEKSGGFIETPEGRRTHFPRVGDTYAREITVPISAAPRAAPQLDLASATALNHLALFATVGGSSSSGLRRDANGRQVDSDAPVPAVPTDLTQQQQSRSRGVAPDWNSAPPRRVRYRVKSRELVDHEPILGPEPRVLDDDRQHSDLIDPPAEDVPRLHGRFPGAQPKQSEVRDHNLTHLPFQSWCGQCVRGRGVAQPHRRLRPQHPDLDRVIFDWSFLRDREGGSS